MSKLKKCKYSSEDRSLGKSQGKDSKLRGCLKVCLAATNLALGGTSKEEPYKEVDHPRSSSRSDKKLRKKFNSGLNSYLVDSSINCALRYKSRANSSAFDKYSTF
ncbi:conserved hypothetical protein [Ricinus communis]|uniref:Uncharacterized protein n=1 Tax=Ricinus communis TaxID=3988 RepID=B9SLA8_RICCO|nr:conserved hypothetical protein [Ricinus communis]